MKKKTAGNRRFIITKNLIMMLVMLVVIFVAIFAWYSNNDTVTASETTISAKGADNVELALPKEDGSFPTNNDDWTDELHFQDSGYFLDMVKDITSNGKQFVIPSFMTGPLETGRVVLTEDLWEPGLSSYEAITNNELNDDDQYNYISFDFYIRSQSPDINVTSESFLAAGSELGFNGTTTVASNAKLLKGSDIYRPSTYGAGVGTAEAFSSDAIVGAMRVSLVGAPVASVNNSAEETLSVDPDIKFLWLPRPDVYLKADNSQNNWKLYTGIRPSGNTARGSDLTADQVNAIAQKTYCHSFYYGETVSGTLNKGLTAQTYYDANVKDGYSGTGVSSPVYFKVSKITSETPLSNAGDYPTLGQAANVASGGSVLKNSNNQDYTFTQGTENTSALSGYYVYKYTLNVWIEGEDAEARRSMSDGVFTLELDFGS